MAGRDKEGFILIDRNILSWQWWHKHNTLVVFLWLLLKANYHQSSFRGQVIDRGQVATTIENIALSNNLTRQQVRTSISHLKSTGEITIRRCPTFLVITISKYDEYQKSTIKSTGNQPSINHQSTINQPHPKKNKEYITRSKKKETPPPGEETVMPGRDVGTVDDIPLEFRDGTYQSFETYAAYWDWRNQ